LQGAAVKGQLVGGEGRRIRADGQIIADVQDAAAKSGDAGVGVFHNVARAIGVAKNIEGAGGGFGEAGRSGENHGPGISGKIRAVSNRAALPSKRTGRENRPVAGGVVGKQAALHDEVDERVRFRAAPQNCPAGIGDRGARVNQAGLARQILKQVPLG